MPPIYACPEDAEFPHTHTHTQKTEDQWSCKCSRHLVLVYILMLLYMYIAPGQGQTTPWGQMLMSTESPYDFSHLLQVLKLSL